MKDQFVTYEYAEFPYVTNNIPSKTIGHKAAEEIITRSARIQKIMKDQSEKNTNITSHEGAPVPAGPQGQWQPVDIEKEKQPNIPEVVKTEIPPYPLAPLNPPVEKDKE